jgi:hypothetical protein
VIKSWDVGVLVRYFARTHVWCICPLSLGSVRCYANPHFKWSAKESRKPLVTETTTTNFGGWAADGEQPVILLMTITIIVQVLVIVICCDDSWDEHAITENMFFWSCLHRPYSPSSVLCTIEVSEVHMQHVQPETQHGLTWIDAKQSKSILDVSKNTIIK